MKSTHKITPRNNVSPLAGEYCHCNSKVTEKNHWNVSENVYISWNIEDTTILTSNSSFLAEIDPRKSSSINIGRFLMEIQRCNRFPPVRASLRRVLRRQGRWWQGDRKTCAYSNPVHVSPPRAHTVKSRAQPPFRLQDADDGENKDALLVRKTLLVGTASRPPFRIDQPPSVSAQSVPCHRSKYPWS